VRRALACSLLLAGGLASASEPDLFGLGPRSGAMAGMGVADAEGWEATYLNPAGVVGPKRRRLTLGYVGARYGLSLDGASRNVQATDGILIGAELPLPFGGVLTDRLALGLGFYFPVGLINRASDGFPDEPRLALLDSRTQVVSVLVSAGARVHERVRVGVGVLALAALVGEIDVTPDAAGHYTTVAEEQLIASFAPVLGVRVEAARWAQVGLAYRAQSTSGYDIQIRPKLGSALPIQLPTLRIAGTAQFDPHQIAAEGAFDVLRWLRLSAGLTWKHWSAYEYPVENATAGAPPKPNADYHDTAVPRVSGEATGRWGRTTLQGRLGYFYEPTPAPDGADRVLLDADRHVITGGVGLGYVGRLLTLQLDAFAQWHHLAGSTRAAGDIAVFGATLGLDL
jgi:long-chain fatty acid transport protein